MQSYFPQDQQQQYQYRHNHPTASSSSPSSSSSFSSSPFFPPTSQSSTFSTSNSTSATTSLSSSLSSSTSSSLEHPSQRQKTHHNKVPSHSQSQHHLSPPELYYHPPHCNPHYCETASSSIPSSAEGGSSNTSPNHRLPLQYLNRYPHSHSQSHPYHHPHQQHLPNSLSRSSISSDGSAALFSPTLEESRSNRSHQYSPVTPPSLNTYPASPQEGEHCSTSTTMYPSDDANQCPEVKEEITEMGANLYGDQPGENGHQTFLLENHNAMEFCPQPEIIGDQNSIMNAANLNGHASSNPLVGLGPPPMSLEGAHPAKMVQVEAVNVIAPPPPPPNPPMQPNYISQLATYLAEMVAYLWFSPPKQHKASFPKPSSGFMRFCNDILMTTQVSQSVVVLALYFISKLQGKHLIVANAGSEYKLTIASLMLANKILDDHTYTNKTWSDVSGLPLVMLNDAEMEFLKGMDFDLHVSQTAYNAWFTMLCSGGNISLDRAAPSRKRAKLGKAIAPSAPVSPINAAPIGSGNPTSASAMLTGTGLGFDFTCPMPNFGVVPPTFDGRPHTSSEMMTSVTQNQQLPHHHQQQIQFPIHPQQEPIFDARWSFAAAQEAQAQRHLQQQQLEQFQRRLSHEHYMVQASIPPPPYSGLPMDDAANRKRRYSDAILAPPPPPPPSSSNVAASAPVPPLHVNFPLPTPTLAMTPVIAFPAAYTPISQTPGSSSVYSMSRPGSPNGSIRSFSGLQHHSSVPQQQQQPVQYYHAIDMNGFSTLTSSLNPPQDLQQSRPRDLTYYALAAGQQRGGYLTHQVVQPYELIHRPTDIPMQYTGPLPVNAYARPHMPLPRQTVAGPSDNGLPAGQVTPVLSMQQGGEPAQRVSLSLSPADIRGSHVHERALHPEARFVQAAMMGHGVPQPQRSQGNGLVMQASPILELPNMGSGQGHAFGHGASVVYTPGLPVQPPVPMAPTVSQSLNSSPHPGIFTPMPSLQSLALGSVVPASMPPIVSSLPRSSAYNLGYSTFANNGLPGVLSWPATTWTNYHHFAQPHQ